MDSDVALLFLTSEVRLTDYVSPVCLPEDKRSNIILTDFDNSIGEVNISQKMTKHNYERNFHTKNCLNNSLLNKISHSSYNFGQRL